MIQNHQDISLFSNLKFIPQVTFFSAPVIFYQPIIKKFLKRIICQNKKCQINDLCLNCQKYENNSYHDLMHYQFSKNNIMKKQDVNNIIENLSYQSLENNNPKICIIENIEYSSSQANTMFLKFLEEIPNNTFLIFISSNIKKVLATIKSRCQIITLTNQEFEILENQLLTNTQSVEKQLFLIINNDINNFNDFKNNYHLLVSLINQFINHDNLKKFDDNFFLIKNLLSLKEKVIWFFQILLKLTENKIASLNNMKIYQQQLLLEVNKTWKNNNQLFLNHLIELLLITINKLQQIKNINLNLLLNYFFISIYQGYENE